VVRNAEQTREKLLEAAADEFAENGLSGARIDRIAANAGVSKPMIYAYLGDKERLFDAVFEREILAASDIVAFDANDLPGYAARTYDLYVSQPRLWRLLTWARLERASMFCCTRQRRTFASTRNRNWPRRRRQGG
jgi:AcrR family transcriptional regulator